MKLVAWNDFDNLKCKNNNVVKLCNIKIFHLKYVSLPNHKKKIKINKKRRKHFLDFFFSDFYCLCELVQQWCTNSEAKIKRDNSNFVFLYFKFQRSWSTSPTSNVHSVFFLHHKYLMNFFCFQYFFNIFFRLFKCLFGWKSKTLYLVGLELEISNVKSKLWF